MEQSSINSFLCDGKQADRLIHASLFSGIGGFDLAAEWMGWQNAFHCEWNEFGQKTLKYYWPNAISYGDITKTDFNVWRGRIDILTGGFPCQPYSTAGKRKGKEDERHLWPEMLRAIREIAPCYIVGENVYGLTNWNGGLVFNEVQTDLESEGYEVQPVILPACAVGAPHRRERVWFVAYSDKCTKRPSRKGAGINRQGSNNNDKQKERGEQTKQHNRCSDVQRINTNATNTRVKGVRQRGENTIYELGITSDTNSTPTRDKIQTRRNLFASSISADTGCSEWKDGIHGEEQEREAAKFGDSYTKFGQFAKFPKTEPTIRSGNDGLSNRLGGITFPKWRNESIKAYGNAIVPQVAYEIFKVIEQINYKP